MIKHFWVKLLWKSKPLGFRKYTIDGVLQASLWSCASTLEVWIWKVLFIQILDSSRVGFFEWQIKMSFQNFFLFENKTRFKSSVSQRKSGELNSVLSGISILEKPFSNKAVAFFTVMFNSFQIFVSFLFKMFS